LGQRRKGQGVAPAIGIAASGASGETIPASTQRRSGNACSDCRDPRDLRAFYRFADNLSSRAFSHAIVAVINQKMCETRARLS